MEEGEKGGKEGREREREGEDEAWHKECTTLVPTTPARHHQQTAPSLLPCLLTSSPNCL